jgi:single-strand DNA-binding protein
MNNWSFTGNLGKDCRIGSAGGSAVCNFSVAVKSGFGQNEQTIWADCALWGKQAESKLIDYLKKGQQVAVTGELGTRDNDGKTYITCRVSSVSLIGGRSENEAQEQPQQQEPQQQAPQKQAEPDFDFEIPF